MEEKASLRSLFLFSCCCLVWKSLFSSVQSAVKTQRRPSETRFYFTCLWKNQFLCCNTSEFKLWSWFLDQCLSLNSIFFTPFLNVTSVKDSMINRFKQSVSFQVKHRKLKPGRCRRFYELWIMCLQKQVVYFPLQVF